MKEGSFCFEYDPLVDEGGSCSSRLLAHDVVQMAGGHVQQPGIAGHLVEGGIFFIHQLFEAAEQRSVTRDVICIELLLVEAREIEQEDLQVALEHAFFPMMVLPEFGEHLVHQGGKVFLVCGGQGQGLSVVGILKDGEIFQGFAHEEEVLCEGQ